MVSQIKWITRTEIVRDEDGHKCVVTIWFKAGVPLTEGMDTFDLDDGTTYQAAFDAWLAAADLEL